VAPASGIQGHAARTPWPADFPDVVIHTSVPLRDAHPCYTAAKSGDAVAALTLAADLLSPAALDRLGEIVGSRAAILLPVIADEAAGFNAVPDAMAQRIATRLRLSVAEGTIVQSNKVGHTRAPAFQRLVTPALFEGPVEKSADYVLVDDHVGLGGTLANLRGFIEANGGNVIAMTTLTESRDARRISIRPETKTMLWKSHGDELDQIWRTQFGYGIDCLTEVEALQLSRQPSVIAIEDFLVKAAIEARRRGLAPTF